MKTTYLGPWLDSKVNYKQLIENLLPEPGTCIFLDICDSTLVKNTHDLSYWITVMRNTVSIGQTLPSLSQPLKLIGDEIMYYIPDSELAESGESYATIFDSVKNFMSTWGNEFDSYTMKLKGAIHYCADVYPISFIGSLKETSKGIFEMEPFKDFYGSGIDLTARLMKKAEEKLIVISDDFFNKAHSQSPEFFNGIQGPFQETFKGFQIPTTYWTYKVR